MTNLSNILPVLAIIDHQFSSNSETNATSNEDLKNLLQNTYVKKATLLDTTGQNMFGAIRFYNSKTSLIATQKLLQGYAIRQKKRTSKAGYLKGGVYNGCDSSMSLEHPCDSIFFKTGNREDTTYKVKSFDKISLENNTTYLNPQELALVLYYNKASDEKIIKKKRKQKGFYIKRKKQNKKGR